MKKRMLWMVIVAAITITGCSTNTENQITDDTKVIANNEQLEESFNEQEDAQEENETENPDEEKAPAQQADEIDDVQREYNGENYKITKQNIDETYTDMKGDTLVDFTVSYPLVETKNEEVNDKINAYFIKMIEDLRAEAESAKEYAGEQYISFKADGYEFSPYNFDVDYIISKADDKIMNFVIDSYSYVGGAHGISNKYAAAFNPSTGDKYELADVVDNYEEAVAFIENFIREELKTDKYKNMLFEDYENYISDILTNDTWFFDENGFNIIVNEYIIAPYAAGKFTITIPYEKFSEISKFML